MPSWTRRALLLLEVSVLTGETSAGLSEVFVATLDVAGVSAKEAVLSGMTEGALAGPLAGGSDAFWIRLSL